MKEIIKTILKNSDTSLFRKIFFTLIGVVVGGFGFLYLLVGLLVGYSGSYIMLVAALLSSLLFIFSMMGIGFKKEKFFVFLAIMSFVLYFIVGLAG